MPVSDRKNEKYKKAKDLKVVVTVMRDNSPEGQLRVKQAKAIICQLILLSKKRGRPSKTEEEINYDAA